MTTADQPLTELEEKAAYAAALLREPDPFKAALSLFPEQTSKALKMATFWPNDPDVIAAKKLIREQSEDETSLPSKHQLALDIWNKMQGIRADGSIGYVSPEDYAKLAKLYADVRSFIEKPSTAPVINNNLLVQKAIEVPVFESAEAWEAAVEKQQTELLNVSRSKH